MQYSIKDIANLSGVSTATVSRVINNKGKYSEETRKKVLKVIEETGYIINESAQSLRTNVTNTIGILVPDIMNPFFADLVQKIEELLFKKHYSTFICNTGRSESKEKAYLQRLENKKVDGVIVISGSGKEGFKFESSIKDIPYICIDRKPVNINDTIFVSSNHYQGARDATAYLIDHGVKHPVLVLDHYSTSASTRMEGFKDYLKDNNFKFYKSKNILFIKKDDDLEQFLKKFPNTDGFFASNDRIGIKLIQKLKVLNYHVPDDIQVIGFDNISLDEFVDPSLTTIAQDTVRIAEKAVSNILDSIKGRGEKGSKLLIPTTLVKRNSTL